MMSIIPEGMRIASYIDYDLITISLLPGNIQKPDKRIFDLALKKSGLFKAGDESIFVTEEMSNIIAARSYGWRAIMKRNMGECRPRMANASPACPDCWNCCSQQR